jgi:hypothetical protein
MKYSNSSKGSSEGKSSSSSSSSSSSTVMARTYEHIQEEIKHVDDESPFAALLAKRDNLLAGRSNSKSGSNSQSSSRRSSSNSKGSINSKSSSRRSSSSNSAFAALLAKRDNLFAGLLCVRVAQPACCK